MDLKTAIAREMESVFLNPSEFAELVVIDGREVAAVWADDNRPGPSAHKSNVDAWGLVSDSAVLHVSARAFPLPVPGQVLEINYEPWTVTKARERVGGYRIELERNRS